MAQPVYRLRTIRSKKRVDALKFIFNAIDKELDNVIMPRLETFLNRFTRNGSPKMQIDKSRVGPVITRFIRPVGDDTDKWKWVSQGTGDHGDLGGQGYPIPVRQAPFLRFQARYDPMTLPGGKFGGAGVKYGHWRKEKIVMHFGIRPRRFEHEAVLWLDQWGWRRRIENAIRRGLRAAAKQQKAQTTEV